VDLFDEAALLPSSSAFRSGIRLPDGRALAWSDYGSSRGLPCLLLPDTGSSRLAPRWLLHDAALPAAIRMIAIDRPGVGASDPIGFGGQEDPAEDLRHLVDTLAVGRVAVIGIGQGATDALAFATRYPFLMTSVIAVSPRLRPRPTGRHHRLRPPSWSTASTPDGPVAAWLAAIGTRADLTDERIWGRAVRRMDDRARRVLGERWREPDFRAGLAADLAEARGPWTIPATQPAAVDWATTSTPVVLQIWHGRDESGTTLHEIRTIAERRRSWEVRVVNDASAIFGAWPEILAAAAGSFGTAAA
jgi:pimeloyl-ACP methyl ester carboxylesterase